MKYANSPNAYNSDNLDFGYEMKIKRELIIDYDNENCDISAHITKSVDELKAMREKSTEKEQAIFERIQKQVPAWEIQAMRTAAIERAIKYLEIPEVEHTSNKWGRDEYDNYDCISNKVYKMYCRMYDYKSYQTDSIRWTVQWHVLLNNPEIGGYCNIARQERTFADKADAEKYLQGRIKTYSHLFKEICPPIPKQYVPYFKAYGQLIRGYTTEDMQREKSENAEKPSVRKQLDSLKNNVSAKKQPAKEHSQPELD